VVSTHHLRSLVARPAALALSCAALGATLGATLDATTALAQKPATTLTGPESLGACSASPLYLADAVCSPGPTSARTIARPPDNGIGSDDVPSIVKTTVPVAADAPLLRCAGDTRAVRITVPSSAALPIDSLVTVAFAALELELFVLLDEPSASDVPAVPVLAPA